MSSLEERVGALESQVAALRDRSEIQDLRFRYHVAVNEKDLDAIPELFSEEAEVEFEGLGSARGRGAIDGLYRELVGGSPFIKQFIHNHLIRLDGDMATGQSYLDARVVRDGESVLVAARFDDAYERTPAGWRFSRLRLTVFFATPLREGWADCAGTDASREP